MKKKLSSLFLCFVICCIGHLSVLALPSVTGGLSLVESSAGTAVFQGSSNSDVSHLFSITNGSNSSTAVYTAGGAALRLGDTYYFRISDAFVVDHASLQNSVYFDFKTETISGSRFLDNVRLTNQSYTGSSQPYIAITLKENANPTTDRLMLNVYFQARQSGTTWSSGSVFNAYFDLQVQTNVYTDTENDIEVNRNVVYQPQSNANHTIYWDDGGRSIAILSFRTGDNPNRFNALLSTKINNNVYAKYADPVGARLHFRTFSENAVLSASRATLYLANPFSWEVSPGQVRIYGMNGSVLTDMTNQFTYDRNRDLWYIHVRSPGSYVISDRALPQAVGSIAGTSTPLAPSANNTISNGATVKIVPLRYLSASADNLQPTPPTGDAILLPQALILFSVSALLLVSLLLYRIRQAKKYARQH